MNKAIILSLKHYRYDSIATLNFSSGFWKRLWCIFLNEQIAMKRVMNNHIIADVNSVEGSIPVDKCDVISCGISLQCT